MNYKDKTDIQVFAIGESEASLWQSYVGEHPHSTVYHHWAWRNIFGQSFGYQSWYLLAQANPGGQVVGCLPLFLVTSPFSRRLVAVPFRDRGGLLWSTPAAFNALLSEAKRIAGQVKAAVLEFKSVIPYPTPLTQSYNLQEELHWVNSCIDLSQLNSELYWNKIGSKTRNMIRQAEQAGLTFDDATDLDEGGIIWYKLHLATQKRLGLPPFPYKFFQIMLQELRTTDRIRLFLIRHNQQAIAGTIILLHQQTAIYGYSASHSIAQSLRPNDFMIFNVIKWLFEHNYSQFDLGSDAPSQKGLLFFKKKWLAHQTTIPVYTFGQTNYSLVDSSDRRYALIRRGFSYLPTQILRLAGNITTKYLG